MLSTLRRHALGATFASVGLAQQQQWVPAEAHGTTGVPITASPLPPRLLQVAGSLLTTAVPVWEFATGSFHLRTETAPPELVFAEAAVYDAANQRIVVWCSSFQGTAAPNGVASVCSFDGARWQVETANLPPARQQPAFGYDPQRGAIVLFGGLVPGFPVGVPRSDTWELRGSQWTQVAAASRPTVRYGSALAYDPVSQHMLLFGGGDAGQTLADTWSFDGITWTAQPATGPSARRNVVLELDAQRQVLLLYGGIDRVNAGAVPLGDAFEWTGSGWLAVPTPAAVLSSPALLRSGNDLLLLGHDDAAAQLVIWRRVGLAWVPHFAHQELPGAFYPAFAFDDHRGELVRFSGREVFGGTFYTDTMVWNGSWQQRHPLQSPPPRAYAAMAFDPLRSECVLFGGLDSSGLLGDTWVWNGVTWAQRTPASAPSPRYLQAMAFDPSRGTVVLHGGSDTGAVQQDTWEWNGAGWSQINTPAPTAAYRSRGLAFDVGRQVLALYIDGGSVLPSELWELRNGIWTQATPTAPAASKLVYDPVRGDLVLFDARQRFDFVNGAFVADPQPGFGGDYLVDSARQQMLGYAATTLDQQVAHSVPVAAQAEAYGNGCGPLGETTLSVDRAPQLGSAPHWQVRAWAPAPVFLGICLQPANSPLGNGCTVLVGSNLAWLFGVATATGWSEFATPVPAVSSLIGLQVYGQAVAVLPQFTLALSNGVRLRLGQ